MANSIRGGMTVAGARVAQASDASHQMYSYAINNLIEKTYRGPLDETRMIERL
jgi:hypothetical protein